MSEKGNDMRVISGLLKGAKLHTLSSFDIRPTTDRVKEGIFSSVQFQLQNANVLDLFAGSGQLGIEALSRGAAHCVFVDSDPKAIEVIKRNISNLKLHDKSTVILSDVFAYLKKETQKFDIIFADPPYKKKILNKTLKALEGKLSPNSVVLCEHEKDSEKIYEKISNLSLYKIYKYGKIEIVKYTHTADGGVCIRKT